MEGKKKIHCIFKEKHIFQKILMIVFTTFLIPSTTLAFSGDLSISSENLSISQTQGVVGQYIRLYASVSNTSDNDLLGTVRFYDADNVQIESDQPISVLAKKTDDVFVDWLPQKNGYQTITATIDPWNADIDDPNNNSAIIKVYIDKDTDKDGTGDEKDADDDQDGTPDQSDAFPLDASESQDSDQDKIGNNKDPDDDNDNIPDSQDMFPMDAKEAIDSDKDGQGDSADMDDDNDKLNDTDEEKTGTDPLNPDTDGDTTIDGEDDFPLDPLENMDFDKDGTGDNKDTDDDNDDLTDADDSNDHNHGPVITLDPIPPKYANLRKALEISVENSYDPDGEIQSVHWLIDEKTVKKGPILKYAFEKNGQHAIKIIMIDDKGEKREKNFQTYIIDYQLLGILAGITALLLAMGGYFYYTLAAHKPAKKKNEKKHSSKIL